ncbi:MAG: hypothetical protein E7277_04340 [Lachnospiraceae bacterium]|nr:hypothetical protein [Lachnospiraceae bacterium]
MKTIKMTDKRILAGIILLICIVVGIVKTVQSESVEMNSLVKDMKFYCQGKEVPLKDETMCKLSQIIANAVKEGFSKDDQIDSAMRLENERVDYLGSDEGVVIVEFKKPVTIEPENDSLKIKCVALCMEEGDERIYCFRDEYEKRPQRSCVAFPLAKKLAKEIHRGCE